MLLSCSISVTFPLPPFQDDDVDEEKRETRHNTKANEDYENKKNEPTSTDDEPPRLVSRTALKPHCLWLLQGDAGLYKTALIYPVKFSVDCENTDLHYSLTNLQIFIFVLWPNLLL